MGRPLGRKTITVLTPQKSADPYSGEQVDDWSLPPAEVLVKGCDVQPGASQEYPAEQGFGACRVDRLRAARHGGHHL